MNKEEFIKSIKDLGLNPSEDKLNKLEIYYNFLIEYNKNVNITRITDKEDTYLKHFYDSLTLAKYIDLNSINKVLDIGTGAGFPGVVLKIFFPNIDIYLLDSNNKKLEFIRQLSEKLDIKVNLIHERAEDYIKNNRECFDLVVSRAVANLRVLSELCIPYVKLDSYFIALKSNIEEELEESRDTINILGGKIESINEFNLPKEESKRTIILIKKIGITPSKYPRKFDKIKKEIINKKN